jgi:platelet-activating factor acetylhydrolase
VLFVTNYKFSLFAHNSHVSFIMPRSRIPQIFRPRFTLRYIASSIAVIYVVYCWLWDMPLLSTRLPAYTGPHSVGLIDIESPCDGRKTSNVKFKSTGEPAFQVN